MGIEEKIKNHYKKMAEDYKDSKQSTMPDINIRDMEVDKIIEVLDVVKDFFEDPSILEVGCGNGYASEQINNRLNIKSMNCIDYCEDLIKIAKDRGIKKVNFELGNVLDLKFKDSSFDIVFSERCLINLTSWENQKKSLEEIRRILKKDGVYIMVEAFVDSLKNLNEARDAISLPPIKQPFHNIFLKKTQFFEFIKGKFEEFSIIHKKLGDLENFLSSYYFGSRVLYPSLIKNKELKYNNKFVEFFRYLPAYGDYGYVNMFVLKKI